LTGIAFDESVELGARRHPPDIVGIQLCQRAGHDERGFHRPDARHQRLDARTQKRAVFRLRSHHEKDGVSRNRFQFELHFAIRFAERQLMKEAGPAVE
jgi:hypothetical protein